MKEIYKPIVVIAFMSISLACANNNSTSLYPSYVPSDDIEYVSVDNLPVSACFKNKCFDLYYAKNHSEGTMYVVLTENSKKRFYKFYVDKISNIFVEDDKLYIVFVDQTELHGWIELIEGEFVFRLFYDPEL